jgi:hypothetical protein
MTNTVDANRQLEGCLHYDPDAYWCPECWCFTKDCPHLVLPLTARLVHLEDWLIRAVRYDRARRILEVHLHAGGAYQHFGVPLDLALKLVRSHEIGQVFQQKISGHFPFKRVRVSRTAPRTSEVQRMKPKK